MGYSIWREENTTADPKKQSTDNGEQVIIESSQLESFVQQNSPVNNELIRNQAMNSLYGTEVDGQLKIMPTEVTVREKHGKLSPVYALCSFSFDESGIQEAKDNKKVNLKSLSKITGYDRRVYNALGTLWLNGRKTVSLTEIFDVMHGYARKNPTGKQVDAIEKSLNKLKNIKVYIDLTQEVTANMIKDKQPLIEAGILKNASDDIKSAVLEDNMIHFRLGTIESKKGRIFKSIQLVGEPSLLTYNRAKGTLLTIPMEYIGVEGANATEKMISFQDYLLMRIISYKNGRMKENRILYDTIYRDSGVEKPKDEPANEDDKESKKSKTAARDLFRDRKYIKDLLKVWVKKGLITGYADIKKGKQIVGFEFYTDEDDTKISKKSN